MASSITRDELVAKAAAMGVEIAADATKAQIVEAINLATPPAPEESPEPTQADLENAEIAENGTTAEETVEQDAMKVEPILTPVEPVFTPAPAPVQSEGMAIADAIVKGLAATKEDKRIRIVSDPSVKSLFSVVRNKKTGEVMLRENATGVLSRVQLESLEEKEASIQGQEVEEV